MNTGVTIPDNSCIWYKKGYIFSNGKKKLTISINPFMHDTQLVGHGRNHLQVPSLKNYIIIFLYHKEFEVLPHYLPVTYRL